MIQRYRVLGQVVPEGERLQPFLAEAYARKLPVLCECRQGCELPLYIAHRNERAGPVRARAMRPPAITTKPPITSPAWARCAAAR